MRERAPAYFVSILALALAIARPVAAQHPSASFELPGPDAYLLTLKIDAPASRGRPVVATADGVATTYAVWVGNALLDPASATVVELYPHLQRRRYADGVVEEATRVEGAILIHVATQRPVRVAVGPVVSHTEAARTRAAVATRSRTARVDTSPARVDAGPLRDAWFVVAVGPSVEAAEATAGSLARDARQRAEALADRLGRRLLESYVSTADPRFDRVLAWMKTCEQRVPVRGDFEAVSTVPGLLLATGRLEEARDTLARIATEQVSDAREPTWGLLRGGDAEATCRWVRVVFEYALYSGDLEFARRTFPAVAAATDGAMRNRAEADGLLTGERVHVQALWFGQLEAAARLAHLVADKEASERWERHGAKVRRAFRERFPTPSGVLAERIHPDGSPSEPGGPEQILALTASFEPLLSLVEGRGIVRDVAARDRRGDPRITADLAVALARYHREDLAFAIIRDMATAQLERFAGAGAEIDPVVAAEVVRVFTTALLGLRPDATAEQLALVPALPVDLGTVRAIVPFAGNSLQLVSTQLGGGRTRCSLAGARLAAPMELVVGAPGPQGMLEGSDSFMLAPGAVAERLYIRRPLPPRADPGEIGRPR